MLLHSTMLLLPPPSHASYRKMRTILLNRMNLLGTIYTSTIEYTHDIAYCTNLSQLVNDYDPTP